MRIDPITGAVHIADACGNEWDTGDLDSAGNFFTADRIANEANDVRKFGDADIRHVAYHLDRSGILEMIKQWRAEDRAGAHPGGRPASIDDRAIILLTFLLFATRNGFLIQELAKMVAHNLDDSAMAALGIKSRPSLGDAATDELAWYHTIRRAVVRLNDTFDAFPGKRIMYTQEERRELFATRDPADQEKRKERAAKFNAEVLQMTYMMQPRDLRRKGVYKGIATVDQTVLAAVSQTSARRKDKHGNEQVVRRKSDNSVIERWVLEPDAGLYPRKFATAARETADQTGGQDFEQSYLLSVVLMSQDEPGKEEKDHPNLAMTSSIASPNKEIGTQVVRGMKHVIKNNHRVKTLVGDRAYGAGRKVEEYHEPLRQLGVGIVTEYKGGSDRTTQFGPKGGYAGSILTEGEFFCCATPKNLLNAARDNERGLIDEETLQARLTERRAYKLRAKESAAADGSIPMMCPAYGPQATVECPLRKIHPKSSKKLKPVIEEANIPEARDLICSQTSVKFPAHVGQKYRQAYPYKSPEWERTMAIGRSTVESLNNEFKTKAGTITPPHMRRMRGLTALHYITTIALAHFNLQRIASFLKKQQEAKAARDRGERISTTPGGIRARDLHHKTGYQTADSFNEGDVIRGFEPPPPLRT